MGRVLGCTGCSLLLFAMVALFGLVVIPVLPFGENNPTLMQIKQALLCESGQTYVMEGQNFSDNRGSGRRFQVYCVKPDGTKISVMEKDFLVSALMFAIPFMIGLFLLIGGIGRGVRSTVQRTIKAAQGAGGEVINVGGMQIRVNRGGMNPLSGSSGPIQSGQMPANLTGRLQQIEDARMKGLITQEEYDQMRKRILDENV